MTEKAREAIEKQQARRSLSAFALSAAARLFMLVLVIAPVLFGVYALWQKALADSRFQMSGETLALAGAVRECPESIADLAALGRRFDKRNLLDPGLLADIEAAYGGSVWIKRITRLKRFFPNRVEVEFLIRRPAAQVRHDRHYWLVDSEGVLLPAGGSLSPFPALPEIAGATADVIGGPPGAGRVWTDPAVTGALGVMRRFWASPLGEAFPIDRVVVTGGAFRNADGRAQNRERRFELVSPSGAVVRWGTFNAGDLPGEMTSGEKMWQLQELLRREEALRPGVCFDIRTRLPGYTLLRGGD